MSSKIFEKLQKVNSEKDEVVFKMEYKGKVIHESTTEIPSYAKEILEDEDISFFYFFKEVSNKFEDLVNEIHKKKEWEKLDKDRDNGKNESN